MRRVAITVDVEAHGFRAERDHVERLIWGRQAGREHGIGKMMDIADRHGAALTFFVDYPECELYGEGFLDVAREIRRRGHDPQPHCHPEYLGKKLFGMDNPDAVRIGDATREQAARMAKYLVDCHVRAVGSRPLAHRSRGYELSAPWLDALKEAGFALDASYSLSCKRDPLHLGLRGPFRFSNDLLEIPVPFVPYFKNVGPLIPWNFNQRCFLTLDIEENLRRHEAFLEAWFKRHGDAAVATLVMHSWSFWKMDAGGFFTIPDDAGVELFERLLAFLKTKYEIIALEQVAREKNDVLCDPERIDASISTDHCPVCYEPVSHFQDYAGTSGRLCPFCRSEERHRTLVELVYAGAFGPQIFHGKDILHIAPSRPESLLLRRMHECRVTTLDIRPGCDVQADISSMPLVADNSFDVVLAGEIFRHVRHLDKALAEIARVLRPGGLLLCSDCLKHADYGREVKDWEKSFTPYFHSRLFKADDKATGSPAWWLVCMPRESRELNTNSILALSAPLLESNAARIFLDASSAPIRQFLPAFHDWQSFRAHCRPQNLDWLKESIFTLQFEVSSQVHSQKASPEFPSRYPSHIHPYPFQSFTYLLHELQADADSGDSAALQRLSSEIERWIDAYGFSLCSSAWDRHTRWVVWHDTATGLRLNFMSYLLLRILPLPDYSNELVEKIFRSAMDHFLLLCAGHFLYKESNHGVIQMLSLLAFGRGMPFLNGIQAATALASLRLQTMFATLLTDDGMWKEHSSGYQAFMVRMTELAQTLLPALPSALKKQAGKMLHCLASLVKPDGNLAEFGNTEPKPYALIEPVVSQARLSCDSLQQLTLLSESGYAFLRIQSGHAAPEETSFLALSGAFHSMAHKHCDDLGFIWSEGIQNLLVDSGMQYGYEGVLYSGPLWEKGFYYSCPNRVYAESAHAHNVVEINGQTWSRCIAPYGVLPLRGRRLTERHWILEGQWQRPEGFLQKRKLILSPARWLLVLDELEPQQSVSPEPTEFTQWFHFAPLLELEALHDQMAVYRLPAGSLLHCQSFSPHTRFTCHKGEFAPRLQGWVAETIRSLVPAWALGLHQEKTGASFCTFFSLIGPCREGELVGSGCILHFAHGEAELVTWADAENMGDLP